MDIVGEAKCFKVLSSDNIVFKQNCFSLDTKPDKLSVIYLNELIHSLLVLIIKPTKESSIKNLVSILDEILINEVTRYVIMEPGEVEMSKIMH